MTDNATPKETITTEHHLYPILVDWLNEATHSQSRTYDKYGNQKRMTVELVKLCINALERDYNCHVPKDLVQAIKDYWVYDKKDSYDTVKIRVPNWNGDVNELKKNYPPKSKD